MLMSGTRKRTGSRLLMLGLIVTASSLSREDSDSIHLQDWLLDFVDPSSAVPPTASQPRRPPISFAS